MLADPCIGNRSNYEHGDKVQLSAPKASELRYLSYQHDQAITVGHINARKCSKLYGYFENFALCELIVSQDFQQKIVPLLLPPVLVNTGIKIIYFKMGGGGISLMNAMGPNPNPPPPAPFPSLYHTTPMVRIVRQPKVRHYNLQYDYALDGFKIVFCSARVSILPDLCTLSNDSIFCLPRSEGL